MRKFKRERHNPIELIKQFWPDADIGHITYCPGMTKGDYEIINGATHDGTLMFTVEMLQKSLYRLVCFGTHYKPTEPKNWDDVKFIKYTIGPVKHATVFGFVRLGFNRSSKYPGQRERIRIPVKCEYVMKKGCK